MFMENRCTLCPDDSRAADVLKPRGPLSQATSWLVILFAVCQVTAPPERPLASTDLVPGSNGLFADRKPSFLVWAVAFSMESQLRVPTSMIRIHLFCGVIELTAHVITGL